MVEPIQNGAITIRFMIVVGLVVIFTIPLLVLIFNWCCHRLFPDPLPVGSGELTHARDQLSSNDLAALIVEALIDGQVVPKEEFGHAVQITANKIELRKALGDY
jgi:hypothetical protein